LRYCGILRRGSQVSGAGQPFDCLWHWFFVTS
jgi:hypothetical protein